ncbi:hypothetical protein ACWGIU_03190 [Streptomyces sp. NPDC054840]
MTETDPTALIDDVLSRIVHGLEAFAPTGLRMAAERTNVNVGESYDGRTWTGGVCPLIQRYPTGKAFMAALAAGSPDALDASIEVLAVVAPSRAMSYALEILQIDLGGFTFSHNRVPFELVVRGRAQKIIKREPESAPSSILLDMLRRRVLSPSEVPRDKFAGMPIGDLIVAVGAGEIRLHEAECADFLSGHPALREGAGLLDVLIKTRWFTEAGGHDGGLAIWLTHRLAATSYAPAVPALRDLFARQYAFLPSAGLSLLEIGTPDALDAAASAFTIEGVPINDYHGCERQAIATEALLRVSPSRAFDEFTPLFTEEGLRAADARMVSASTVLEKLTPSRAVAEPRWIERCFRLLKNRALGDQARTLLRQLDPTMVTEAATRVKKSERTAARRPVKATGDLLHRYCAGDHEGVWQELRMLDPEPLTALATQAEAVATETMERVRLSLAAIVEKLRAESYPFNAPASVLVPPAPNAPARVAELERLLGIRLPLSLRAFYLTVGAVDLSGNQDSFFSSLKDEPDDEPDFVDVSEEYPFIYLANFDPLVIIPIDFAIAEAETLRASKEEECGLISTPHYLRISPPMSFKVWPETAPFEPWDAVCLPGTFADAELHRGNGEAVPFLDHLRDCLKWGGFPGLASVSIRPQVALDALAEYVHPL